MTKNGSRAWWVCLIRRAAHRLWKGRSIVVLRLPLELFRGCIVSGGSDPWLGGGAVGVWRGMHRPGSKAGKVIA